jgi:ACS family hexuronate transporter-like MFS transporter
LSANVGELRAARSTDIALIVILAVNFGCAFLSRNSIGLIGPFLGPRLVLSNTELGALSAGLSFAWAVTGFVGTVFAASRYSARTVLMALAVVGALSLLWTAFSTDFWSALASRLLAGAAAGPVMPLSQALIARRSSLENRGTRMGAMQAFGGSLIGAILAPALLVPAAAAWGGRAAFVVAAGCCLSALVFLWMGSRAFAGGVDPLCAGATTASESRGTCSTRNLVLCCLVSALMVGWLIVTVTFLPAFLVGSLHWPASRMGIAMSGFGVVSLLSTAFVPALSDRYGRRRVMTLCACLGTFAAFGIWCAGAGFASLLLAMSVGVAGGTFPLFMAAIPAESAPRSSVAAWIGAVQGVGELIGGVAAPMAAGLAADKFGPPAALLLAATCVGTAAVASFFFRETNAASAAKPRGDAHLLRYVK